MYAILTENIEVVKFARERNEQVINLGLFKMFQPQKNISVQTSTTNVTKSDNSLDWILTDLLLKLGIPSHLKGFKYLKYGLSLLLSDSKYEHIGITKGLYSDIANNFMSTPCKVERNIRNAIEHSFRKSPSFLIENIFGMSLDSNKDKATNSEFLFGIKEYLEKEYSFDFTVS